MDVKIRTVLNNTFFKKKITHIKNNNKTEKITPFPKNFMIGITFSFAMLWIILGVAYNEPKQADIADI